MGLKVNRRSLLGYASLLGVATLSSTKSVLSGDFGGGGITIRGLYRQRDLTQFDSNEAQKVYQAALGGRNILVDGLNRSFSLMLFAIVFFNLNKGKKLIRDMGKLTSNSPRIKRLDKELSTAKKDRAKKKDKLDSGKQEGLKYKINLSSYEYSVGYYDNVRKWRRSPSIGITASF